MKKSKKPAVRPVCRGVGHIPQTSAATVVSSASQVLRWTLRSAGQSQRRPKQRRLPRDRPQLPAQPRLSAGVPRARQLHQTLVKTRLSPRPCSRMEPELNSECDGASGDLQGQDGP